MICTALLVAGLSGCEKIDVNKLEGTWTEQYDLTVFAMDGSVEYTFDGNNGYQLHVYDALSGESHDYSGHYAIDLIDKGTRWCLKTLFQGLPTVVAGTQEDQSENSSPGNENSPSHAHRVIGILRPRTPGHR